MSDDLEAYLGRNINELKKELEGKGTFISCSTTYHSFYFSYLFQGYTVYITPDDKQIPPVNENASHDEKQIVLERSKLNPNQVVYVSDGKRCMMLNESVVVEKNVVS